MPLFNGPIIGRLGNILRNTGGNLLRDAIVQRLPGSEEIVDAIAGRLGIERGATPDQTAAEIVRRHEAEPAAVEEAATVVVTQQSDRWADALAEVARAAQSRETTMQREAESPHWLIRNWRPIYALETIAEMMLIVIVFLWLLITGDIERANLALVLLTGAYAALRIGVLGVYVGGRSFEKGRGVTR